MDKNQKPDTGGLEFFGKITASISHEIKNNLAIINEVSGLLSDLMLAAEKGRPLEPERLTKLAGKIGTQVGRADNNVKKLNRFAHTADEEKKVVAAQDLLGLLADCTGRLITNRGLVLKQDVPEDSLYLETSPFGMLLVLFACLESILAAAAEKGSICWTLAKQAEGVEVLFSGDLVVEPEFTPRQQEVLSLWQGFMKMTVEINPAKLGIRVFFPK